MIIQAIEAEGRSVGRNFPAIEFAGTKSPDLAFSNVDKYAPMFSIFTLAIKFDCVFLTIFQSFHLFVSFIFNKLAPPKDMFQKMF